MVAGLEAEGRVAEVQVLDAPDADDLLESFAMFLVSASLAEGLEEADLISFALDEATVRPSPSSEYIAAYGAVPHAAFRWLRLRASPPRADAWLG